MKRTFRDRADDDDATVRDGEADAHRQRPARGRPATFFVLSRTRASEERRCAASLCPLRRPFICTTLECVNRSLAWTLSRGTRMSILAVGRRVLMIVIVTMGLVAPDRKS